MKNLMIALTILIASSTYGQVGEKNFIDQNFIEVVGKSELEVTPDEIFLKIVINEKDIKGKTLVEIEKSLIDKLEEIGINTKEDLVIKDLVSNFKVYFLIKADIVLMKEYQLKLSDSKTVGKVFTELQKIGISNVSIDKLNNSNIEKYRQEVKINAIKSAQEKAKSLTNAINQDIGKALYIKEHESIVNMTGALQGKVAGIQIRGISSSNIYGSRAAEPEIEFEKIRLEYSITVRFEIK